MKALKWIVASLGLCVSSALVAGESNRVIVSHYESLQRLSIQSAAAEATQRLRTEGPATLSFDAFGRTFELKLEPNARLLSSLSRSALADGVEIYRGQLAGKADSWARIVVYDGMPRGMIRDGADLFAIEAPGDSLVETGSPVIYRLADTFIAPGAMTCGSESLSGNGAAVFSRLVGELSASMAQGPGAVSEIDIGAVGDFEFTSARGGDAAAVTAITVRLNNVDGIYSQEIGVQVNVPVIDTFSDPASNPFTTPVDPATNETDAGALLDELRSYRANTPSQNSLGLTHLWTGRDLEGSTVGIAYNGVLCRSGVGAGLSEGNSTAVFDSLIAAHEIGHNFGAPHDGTPGSACEAEPQTFIMAPMLNGSTQFSPCSKSIMQSSASAAACVVPLPVVDMSVDLPGQSSTVYLGTSPSLVFEVRSNGTSTATNVTADFALPATLTIDAVSPSAGSCTSGAGTVDCDFGDVPGLTLRTVTIDTTAASVGSGRIDATVTTADADGRPANNQFSMPLNVDPAVDLVVNSPAAVTVALDQAATIRATLENRASMDATGVTLSISFGNRVRADSASWSIGTCTVAAQQVDCQAANFANQSNSTLTVGVTGLTAGAQNYTMTLASSEAEADPSNNTVNGVVTVNDPAQGSSGGGAVGMLFLGLLGCMVLLIRRRATAF